jgi:hypothetical protein
MSDPILTQLKHGFSSFKIGRTAAQVNFYALFHIDVTFEMRTVLYKSHLFNDKIYKHGDHIYIEQKEGKR